MKDNNNINKDLYYLLTWFSPSYPVGSYAYSHGLEYATENGNIKNVKELRLWISDFLNFGTGYNDGILISCLYDAVFKNNTEKIKEICTIIKAFKPTKEISLEASQQGISFAHVVSSTINSKKFDNFMSIIDDNISYPSVVAGAGAICNINKLDLIHAYLHAFISNILSAALRLISIGQTESQILLIKLKKEVSMLINKIENKNINDLGSSIFIGEWLSASHQNQYSRLFRS